MEAIIPSCRLQHSQNLTLSLAVSAALMSGYSSTKSYAGSCSAPDAGGNVVCSGPLPPSGFDPQPQITVTGGDLSVTTTADFAIESDMRFTLNNGGSLSLDDENDMNEMSSIFLRSYGGSGNTSLTTTGTLRRRVSSPVIGVRSDDGSGDVDVNISGDVYGATGIIVSNNNEGSSTTRVTTSGGIFAGSINNTGMFVGHRGTGGAYIQTSGPVNGGSRGIWALSRPDATGVPYPLTIVVSADVISQDREAIGFQGHPTNITLTGGTIRSANGTAISESYTSGNSTVNVELGAVIDGSVFFIGGDDSLRFNGADFSNVNFVSGGAGNDTLSFNGSNGSLIGSNIILWEQLEISDSTISNSGGSEFNFSAGEGVILNNGGVFAADGELNLVSDLSVNNSGALNCADACNITGSLEVNGSGTVEAGTAFNLSGNLSVNSGGMFVGTGNSPSVTVITGNTTNSGEITLQDGELDDSFTITGDYIGDGGVLRLDAVLDDGSSTDRDVFSIGGNSSDSGSPTQVFVNNVGGAGAETGTDDQDGVLLIEVAGTSDAQFELAGTLRAGDYVYDLVQASNGNWYLQSSLAPQSIPVLGGWFSAILAGLLAAIGFGHRSKRRKVQLSL